MAADKSAFTLAGCVFAAAAGAEGAGFDAGEGFLACVELARAADGVAFFASAVDGDDETSCPPALPDAAPAAPLAAPSADRPRSIWLVAEPESADEVASNGKGAFCAAGDGEL